MKSKKPEKRGNKNRFLLIIALVLVAYTGVLAVLIIVSQGEKLPIYWEISSGGELRGYVVPSIHASRVSYKGEVGRLIGMADAVALEIDVNELFSKVKQLNLTGENLEKSLSPETIRYYKGFFGEAEWEIIKTWKAGIVSSIVDSKLAEGLGATNKMDEFAFERGLALDKKIIGLENASVQIEFILNDTEDSIKSLEEVARNETEYLKSFAFIESIYQKADLELMRALCNLGANESAEARYSAAFRDPVLQNRTKEVLKRQKAFVMVGFCHIPGIIDELKKEFEVKEINSVRK